ncbi:MAG: hypothetical protein AAGN35_05960 [Bacteroidota bacterium]
MRHLGFILLLVIGTLGLGACLNTRDVEPPVQANSDWISPTDYTILLDNLQRSVGQRNVQNYLRCFQQDAFVFQAATPVFTGNEIIWGDWSWQDEQAWFNNVRQNLGLTSGNTLLLNEVDLQSFSSDSLRYIGEYDLTMNHTDTSLTVRFVGQLEFLCKVNSFNEWEISRWIDYETRIDSSWSRLKLSYVQ